jgi:hypothetical protein
MWTGPIAASVLVKSAFEEEKVAKFLRINNGDGRLSINTWMRPKKLRVHYPVNVMRNLATEQAKTEVIFPIGVDFLPSRGLHAFLKRLVSEGLFVGRGAFAVPSFEVAKSTTVPRTKQEMLAAIERKLAKPSLSRGDPSSTDGVWEIAHVNFIDYPKWYATNHELYERPIEFHNEPYVVVNRSQPCFPDFDERFIYYGADKVEQIYHLSTRGWRFFVLPLHFVDPIQYHENGMKSQSGPTPPPAPFRMNPTLGFMLFGSAHVFCMTKFLAQTMISKVSKPNPQKPIEYVLYSMINYDKLLKCS